jgi:hypothetical protein
VAIWQIKRFSHSANKDAIDQHVGEHFDPAGPSALDILLAVHLLIWRGLELFTTHYS